TWLALGLGVILVIGIEIVAAPAMHAMAGGDTAASVQALRWMRIAALGAPFVLVTAAAQGWMRALQDTRTPLVVIGLANLASIVLSATLVFGLGMGIRGSAIANVVAQAASGLVFLVLLSRRGVSLRPSLERIRLQFAAARDLTLRTASFFRAFTSDPAVIDKAHVLWPFLVLMMPLNGWVFALDGILFGAGDLRFMRNVTAAAAVLGYLPITLATASFGWGLAGIWIGISAFI